MTALKDAFAGVVKNNVILTFLAPGYCILYLAPQKTGRKGQLRWRRGRLEKGAKR